MKAIRCISTETEKQKQKKTGKRDTWQFQTFVHPVWIKPTKPRSHRVPVFCGFEVAEFRLFLTESIVEIPTCTLTGVMVNK